jgi:redox-sensitive bicupin YhaK (pirin superfamily)
MIDVRRAGDRFRTDQPGITTWHSFSSGAHYDAANLSFGPVLACDEHLLNPGAGFELHRHARVELVSWVLDGALRHEDDSARARVVMPGMAQYQLAGLGIEHVERNASDTEPLHFVQLWLQTDEDVPDYDLASPPLTLTTGRFEVLHRARDQRLPAATTVHLYVAMGRFTVSGHDLGPGDSLRASEVTLDVEGDGQLLVVTAGQPA